MTNKGIYYWTKVSRQKSKLYILFSLLLLCIIVFIAFIIIPSNEMDATQLNEYLPIVAIAWVGVAFIATGFGFFSIGCPKCGCRVIWKIVRTVPSDQFVAALSALDKCPCCGIKAESLLSIRAGGGQGRFRDVTKEI